MPTISVDRERLFERLDRRYTLEELEEVCFEFGIELEEETSELAMASKEAASGLSAAKAETLSARPIYRIDVPANRIDLLCEEGLMRALQVFGGKLAIPTYSLVKPTQHPMLKIHVKPQTGEIRPHIVCAVLRDISFTEAAYENFIELQEKLHANICRRRTLVAIGTHDLDTIQAPFSYEALAPKDIKFTPLNQAEEMDGERLMQFYETDKRLSKFLPIIRSSPVYPVVYDANRRVLSLPPIINGDHSKIKLSTRNVFIECTATDLTKAKIVLNTMVTMFSEYCAKPFTVEPVEVVIEKTGKSVVYPDLDCREMSASVDYISSRIGISPPLTGAQVVEYLAKMGMPASLNADASQVVVSVPPTRSDILHACDVMEDVAVAYGFNNLVETMPKASTIAAPFPLNKLSDLLRVECALAGFTEALPLILCSHDENFKFLKLEDDGKTAIKLANPKTAEYQIVRSSLLPGILKTIKENRKMPLPIKLFEVSDVAFKDDSVERRAKNKRNLCAVYCGTSSGFEVIHGLLDRVFQMLDIKPVKEGEKHGYYIKESNHPTYFPGRQADAYYQGKLMGTFGILHPEVIANFDIVNPCSAFEISIEPFL